MRCFVLVVAAAAGPALAGTTITWQRQRPDQAPTTLTMRCEGYSARFDGAGPRGAGVIWDARAKTLTILRPEEKTYQQLTEAYLAELRAKSLAVREQLKARLAAMPAEQRARAEAMMAQLGADGLPPPPWELKPTGKKAKVGRFDCELYDGARGEVKLELCLVPWASAPARREDFACLKSLAEVLGGLSRGLWAASNGPEHDFDAFPGLPVQTRRELGDGKQALSTLTAVERGAIASDAFTVPPGYTVESKPGR